MAQPHQSKPEASNTLSLGKPEADLLKSLVEQIQEHKTTLIAIEKNVAEIASSGSNKRPSKAMTDAASAYIITQGKLHQPMLDVNEKGTPRIWSLKTS